MNRLLTTCGLLVLAAAIGAQGLTVDEAVDLAIRNNLGLKTQDLAVGIKKRSADQSVNRLYPTLTTTLGAVRLNEPGNTKVLGAVVPTALGQQAKLIYGSPDATSLTAGLTAQWVFSLAAFDGIVYTMLDYRNSLISREQALKKLRTDVRKAYYQLYALQESVRLTQKQLANAAERTRQVTVSFQAGQAGELGLLQAQIGRDQLKPVLDTYEQNHRQALFLFQNLLGLDPDPGLVLAGPPPLDLPATLPTAAELVGQNAAGNLDVKAALGQGDLLAQQIRLLDSSILPTVVAQYTLDPLLNNPSSNDWTKLDNWKQSRGGFSVQLVWKVDALFPGSEYWTTRGNLSDQAAQVALSAQQARRNLLASANSLLDALQRGRANLATWDAVATAADRVLDLTEAAYKAGSRTILEVNDAALAAESAQLSRLGAQQALYGAWLDLQDLW